MAAVPCSYRTKEVFVDGLLVRAIFIAFYYIAIIIKIKKYNSRINHILITIILFLSYPHFHQAFPPLKLERLVIYSLIRNYHHFAAVTLDCYALKIGSYTQESYAL